MAKKLEFSLVAKFLDYASAGLGKLDRTLAGVQKRAGAMGGSSGGLAALGGRLKNLGGGSPGGAGGWLAGMLKGSAELALLPIKIVGMLASMLPSVAGVFGRVVSTGAAILGGLVNVVANIAGKILNLVLGLVQGIISAITGLIQRVIGAISGLVSRVAGAASKVGLVIGGILGYGIYKGVRANLELADMRTLMKKVFGAAATEYEALARRLSLATPFTPTEAIRTVVSLGAGKVDVRKYINDVFDLAAATKGLGVRLEDVVNVFIRLRSGGYGEAFARLRESMTISQEDLVKIGGLRFSKSNQYQGSAQAAIEGVVKVIRKRYGGQASQQAEGGTGIGSTTIGYLQELWRQATAGFAKMWVALLGKINPILEKILASDGWKRFVDGVTTAADAVSGKLLAAIEKTYDFLATRDWSWAALKRGIDEAKEKLDTMWDGLVDAGKEALDSVLFLLPVALGLMKAQLKMWAAQLWTMIQPYVLEIKAKVLEVMSQAFGKIAEVFMDKAAGAGRFSPLRGIYGELGNVFGKLDLDSGQHADRARREASRARRRQTAGDEPESLRKARDDLLLAQAKWEMARPIAQAGLRNAGKMASGAIAGAPGIGDLIPERPGARQEMRQRTIADTLASARQSAEYRQAAGRRDRALWMSDKLSEASLRESDPAERARLMARAEEYAKKANKARDDAGEVLEQATKAIERFGEATVQHLETQSGKMQVMEKTLDRHTKQIKALGTARG